MAVLVVRLTRLGGSGICAGGRTRLSLSGWIVGSGRGSGSGEGTSVGGLVHVDLSAGQAAGQIDSRLSTGWLGARQHRHTVDDA